jgi:tRNA-Thr(GGU) m(6)t(6)A37 methyltransferase TsaA
LTGLKDYSHLQVIFQFHERNEENLPLTVRPEGRSDMPEVGVFATCSPCRPNPIGLTCVEIVNITNHILTVKGLDCHDKTPILDLKPFSDAPENPRIPGWLEILWKE